VSGGRVNRTTCEQKHSNTNEKKKNGATKKRGKRERRQSTAATLTPSSCVSFEIVYTDAKAHTPPCTTLPHDTTNKKAVKEEEEGVLGGGEKTKKQKKSLGERNGGLSWSSTTRADVELDKSNMKLSNQNTSKKKGKQSKESETGQYKKRWFEHRMRRPCLGEHRGCVFFLGPETRHPVPRIRCSAPSSIQKSKTEQKKKVPSLLLLHDLRSLLFP
jgi:hypothetical protein